MASPIPRSARLSRDTTEKVEARQVSMWRALSTVEIAHLVNGASRNVRALAIAGLRERHPDAPERELFLRLAVLTLGADVAAQAYPDVARLQP